MFKVSLALSMLFTWATLQGATANSRECPDPRCCLPSPGPSSCHSEERLCTAYCMHICDDGQQVKCSSRGGWTVLCRFGAPVPGEGPCYNIVGCDPSLYSYDPCSEPDCNDPVLLLELCNKVFRGED